MYILKVYSIHYNWDKTEILKKSHFGQNKRWKKCRLFLLQAPTHHSFTFNIQFSYMSWSTRFVSLKLCVGFSILDSVLFLLNIIIPFKTKIIEKPLIAKLQQEVLKFNDICVSWGYPKPDLVTNFLNLEIRSFENISFLSSNFK